MDRQVESVTILHQDHVPAEQLGSGRERRIIHTAGLMTVVIDFQGGPWAEPDPMHTHPHEQITYVASGEILFISAGAQPVRLKAGDLFAVPPGIPHGIQLLSASARLVDSFTPIREDFLKP
ncbi:putative Pectin degradation protein KdgF [Rhodovastum atsumiense]|uniref:cupin domain-containing protein n=1 Tax=Rhodovastum atsumiense TaxID=504468 RepID=UPI00139F2C3A|nr:cupin domain-containing protein [Rhodovastum atsumiense]CAH2599363.1 putative Pectin degradation protein KdgF [Rhodovastum atsumiense]